MSRQSVRQSIRPSKHRESIFNRAPDAYHGDNGICPPNLLECVYALEDCCEEAQAAQEILRDGTFDLPRMSKVLQNQKLFLLVDENTIRRYKADLVDEIEPQINELIERAEKGVKALEKKQSQLHSKVEAAKSRPPNRPTVGANAASKMEARRLQMLVKQRERIEDELETLETEVKDLESKALKQQRRS